MFLTNKRIRIGLNCLSMHIFNCSMDEFYDRILRCRRKQKRRKCKTLKCIFGIVYFLSTNWAILHPKKLETYVVIVLCLQPCYATGLSDFENKTIRCKMAQVLTKLKGLIESDPTLNKRNVGSTLICSQHFAH